MQGLSIANNLLANNVQYNLNKNQSTLQNTVKQLSSGLRINSAADDPSGLAIATNLQTQVDGFQQASQNVQDANNAAQVAEGALQTETDILQRMRNLAAEAASDINSQSDRNNLQAEISQLILEVNRISQNTNFNGQALLDGSHSGFQAQTLGTADISSNSVLAGTGNLVTSVVGTGSAFTTTAGGAVDGTVEVQIVNTGGTSVSAVWQFFNSATGQVTASGTAATGGNFTTDNGVQVTLGNFATNDAGTTAFIKVNQYVAASSSAAGPLAIQSGANEGDIVQIGIQATNAQTLRISNINVAATAGNVAAEDAIAQIDGALNTLLNQRAQLGAVIVRLNEDANNDNVAAVNLQASESSIRDLNVGQATTEFTKLQVLVQVGTSVLAQANANAQSVLGLFR
ncbi:MAG TPA: flagellin [Candidatus Baltobacteraceae bacterium]|nr:flagellin [Candidatus Baltobacteraceae bacterium]